MLYINGKFQNIFEQEIIITTKSKDYQVSGPVTLFRTLDQIAKIGISIQRYKGLGEMMPQQLWDTTLNPENRTLIQVNIADIVEANDIFSILMGDCVEPRRKFIQDNAKNVINLDA